MLYELAKPLLFALPPDVAHELAMMALGPLEQSAALRGYVRDRLLPAGTTAALEQSRLGLTFRHPVGLAGGFDKNAHRPRALAALGFSFLELGTVTAEPQEANPKPNLVRLPRDGALINRLGFPNDGAEAVAARIEAAIGSRGARRDIDVPVGVSIGKSRVVDVGALRGVIEDYLFSFEAVRRVADFVVVNISSPNTKDLRRLQGASFARDLVDALAGRRIKHDDPVPLLVKVAPDLEDQELDALFDLVAGYGFDGVVATNTTVARTNLLTDRAAVRDAGAGGLSGPPVFARAKHVVARARRRLGPNHTIIGVGGISSVADAISMLAAGADLLQVYTGFVYGGPRFAAELAAGLNGALAASLTRERVGSDPPTMPG